MTEIKIKEDTREMLDRLRMKSYRVYTYDEIIKLLIAYHLVDEVHNRGELGQK